VDTPVLLSALRYDSLNVGRTNRQDPVAFCGLAPADGLLPSEQRVVLLDGIACGMHGVTVTVPRRRLHRARPRVG
jgi:hypothetical protein